MFIIAQSGILCYDGLNVLLTFVCTGKVGSKGKSLERKRYFANVLIGVS